MAGEIAKGFLDIEVNVGDSVRTVRQLTTEINAFQLSLNSANKTQAEFARKYANALKDVANDTGLFNAQIVKIANSAAVLDKTLSKGQATLGQFFSAKFNKNGAIAAEVMGLARERVSALNASVIATTKSVNGMQEVLKINMLPEFSDASDVAAQKQQILSTMLKQGTTNLINFGKNVQWAGRQLMVGFTVPLTIFGNVAGKTFRDLEKEVVAFKKVYGDLFTTPAELQNNLQAVTDLASEYTKYGIAVKDTIGLAAQAAAAGRKNADLTDAVAQATRLATLGQMEQNAALETTISLQSAFKLSGKDLADTINFLNMVENQTVVSLQDLSAAIPRVAPVIQGLGGDVKDLSVFLAAMQEGGVDAAEGANALKSGLASLINPTKQATQMLAGFGINLDAIIKANKGDLMGTVMAFSKALANLDQFSRQQALEQVFGKFQYAKLGALFENISRQGSQAQQVIATMGYSTEQLGATADKELKAIQESFGVQLTGAIERFKLAIAPIGELFVKNAIPIINMFTKIAEGFNNLSDGKKQFIAIATAIVGVVIPAGTMLLGLLMNLTGTITKFVTGFASFAKSILTGNIKKAFQDLGGGAKYLSLAEIDAAIAAERLSQASQAVSASFQKQIAETDILAVAVNRLAAAFGGLSLAQMEAFSTNPSLYRTAYGASSAAKGIRTGGAGFRGVRRNDGGPIVPGVGNTDTVPAMLTPGEFVVNKQATQENLGLLEQINSGNIQGYNKGGKIPGVQYFATKEKVRTVQNIPSASAGLLDLQGMIESGQASQNVIGKYERSHIIDMEYLQKELVKRGYNIPPDTKRLITSGWYGQVGSLPAAVNQMFSVFESSLTVPWSTDEKSLIKRGYPTSQEEAKLALKMMGRVNPTSQYYDEAYSLISEYADGIKNPIDDIISGLRAEGSSKYSPEMLNRIRSNPASLQEELVGHIIKAIEDENLKIFGLPEGSSRRMTSLSDREKSPWAGTKQGLGKIAPFSKNSEIVDYLTKMGRLVTRKGVKLNSGGLSRVKTTITRNRDIPLALATSFGNVLFRGSRARSAVENYKESLTSDQIKIFEEEIFNLSQKITAKQSGRGAKRLTNEIIERDLNNALVKNSLPSIAPFVKSANPKHYMHWTKAYVDPSGKRFVSRMTPLYTYSTNLKANTGSLTIKELLKNDILSGRYGKYDEIINASFKNRIPPLSLKQRKVIEDRIDKNLYAKLKKYPPNTRITDDTPGTLHIEDTLLPILKKTIIRNGGSKEEFMRLTENVVERSVQKRNSGGMIYANAGMAVPKIAKDLAKRWINNSINNTGGSSSIAIRSNPKEMEILKSLATRTTEDQVAMRKMSLSGLEFPKKTHKVLGKILAGTATKNDYDSLFGKEKFGIYNDFASYTKNDLDYLIPKTFTGKAASDRSSYSLNMNSARNALGKVEDIKEFISNGLAKGISREELIIDMQRHPRHKNDILNIKRYMESKGKKFTIQDYLNYWQQSVVHHLSKAKEYARFGVPSDIYMSRSVPKGSNVIDLSDFEGAKYIGEKELILGPQKVDLESISSVLGGSYFTDHPVIRQNRLNALMNKEMVMPLYLKTKTDKPIDFKSLRFNNGGMAWSPQGRTVSGVGNTDTVPAMLTPGEFVVNKEATQKNIDLLHQINNGTIAGYNKGGKIPGVQYFAEENSQRIVQESKGVSRARAVGMAGSMIGGIAGFSLASKLGIDSMMGQFAVSMAAGTVAQKALTGATLLATKSAKDMGAKAAMFPYINKLLSPQLFSRFALALGGTTAAIALAGFAIYKLNKSLKNAEEAGSRMSEAMYGTAKTTENIAAAFGRQTFAQAARISAAEKAGGQKISQEAQQASSTFIQSEAGKQMLKDIGTVKAGGGNAVEALRNQLSSAIIAGAINTEEARAIAVEIGTALNDEKLSIGVSAEITRLMGPNGENMLEDIVSITAEISPKINATKLSEDATKAFEELNAGQRFLQVFKGGKDAFEQNYKLEQSVSELNTVLQRELEARQLLNLAYREGAIGLEEYNKKKSEIESGTGSVADQISSTLGFKNFDELIKAAEGTPIYSRNAMGQDVEIGRTVTEQGKQGQEVLKGFRTAYEEKLSELPVFKDDEKLVEKRMEDLDKIGQAVYADLARGAITEEDIPLTITLTSRGDLSYDEAKGLVQDMQILRAIPNIEKVINIDNPNKDEVEKFKKDLEEIEGMTKEEKKVKVQAALGDAGLDIEDLKTNWNDVLNLPDAYLTVFVTQVGDLAELKSQVDNATDPIAKRYLDFRYQTELGNLTEDVKNAEEIAQQLGLNEDPGGGSSKQKTDWIEFLKNRFDLVEKRLSLEAQKYQDVIRLQERQNELDNRNISINNKALGELSKQEDLVNERYRNRIDLLDGVAESNQRLKEQESSRIDLAKALAEGNVSTAAQIMGQMTANEANYRIEDTRAALEKQKEEDLKNLRVQVNGQLLTRQEIQANIDAIEEQMYQRNILIQEQQDRLYEIEQQRLANSREREKVETRLYLLEQQKAITSLEGMKASKKGGTGLDAGQRAALESFKSSFNQMVNLYNTTYGENIPQAKAFGGTIKKMAFGGMMYKGSNEMPPALKMAFGNIVPGLGNVDRVPALLTPGEFVVRKSAAQANMPLLEMINNGIFPKLGGPSYNVPDSSIGVGSTSVTNSVMYNDTYNINVNVAGTSASPEDIANVVMAKLSQTNRGNVRSIRY